VTSETARVGDALRVAFVPGVTPDKWARVWADRMPRVRLVLTPVAERDQTAVLYDGRADMSFVRLPVDDERLHVIPLYTEVPVVVAPKGHFVEGADEVTLDDLSEELVHQVPPLTAKEAVATVAAGVGVLVVPLSVARLHHRRDVVHRPVTDGPESRVGLAWPRDAEHERIETFIGVVRGRRPGSSRGAPAGPKARRRR
jgi:DNA-binding transcriptional LysR family regulator